MKALEEKDRELFDAVFGCKPGPLVAMIADDFEFLHDRYGMTATSGAQFIASIRDMCEGQKTGRNFRARRELVPGTLTTHALNRYGAMQMGTHRFYGYGRASPTCSPKPAASSTYGRRKRTCGSRRG